MSEAASRTFMELVLNGEVLPEEIDDFVDEWHDGDSEGDLEKFLGMTNEEYSLWISNAGTLGLIIAARHKGRRLVDAVNDNLKANQTIAARSDEAWKIKILRDWIASQRER